MHHDNHPGDAALPKRSAVYAAGAITSPRDRKIAPPDGSVARSGDLVSVFCAQCQRWIDCYDGIPPEVARDRHGTLFH